MDAAAVAAVLRAVRATAERDPAAALPTLVATVGVILMPLDAGAGVGEEQRHAQPLWRALSLN